MDFKLIIAAVKPNITDHIVDAAKTAGATGATIIPGRGTGVHEAKTFFGLSLEAQTDLVLFLIGAQRVDAVLRKIVEEGEFHKPGAGIAFVLPVDGVAGLESQIQEQRKKEEPE